MHALVQAREETLEASVVEVTYRSDDGRFTVATVQSTHRPKDPPVTVVGDLGQVAVGETLKLTGKFSQHAKYGKRFRVNSFVPILPTTQEGIRRYLGSGMIPGGRLVKHAMQ